MSKGTLWLCMFVVVLAGWLIGVPVRQVRGYECLICRSTMGTSTRFRVMERRFTNYTGLYWAFQTNGLTHAHWLRQVAANSYSIYGSIIGTANFGRNPIQDIPPITEYNELGGDFAKPADIFVRCLSFTNDIMAREFVLRHYGE